MASLNDKIVAYLTVNSIAFTSSDYMTGQPIGQPDQILEWNEAKLGPIPTQQQMDEAYLVWEAQQKAAQNKATAQTLLSETDWTATVDISNPEYSNPYLANQTEFLAYRSAIRAIAVNPPVVVDPWPVKPQEVWVTL